MDRGIRQVRSVASEFQTRDDNDNLSIEGYFVVFGDTYQIAPGLSESVAPTAFDNTLSNDIRALINHDSTLVLGRTKAGTLTLKTDSRGLWGHIDINRNDTDAMNLYERVKRGDVSNCSFGFNIRSEDTDIKENGDIHWTITDVELFEVSCCTFPAYEETNISAREKQRDEIKKRTMEKWRADMKARLSKWH